MRSDKFNCPTISKKLYYSLQQIQEIERKAITSIRSLAEDLTFISKQIQLYQQEMPSLNASPIKKQSNVNSSFNYTPLKEFIKKENNEKQSKYLNPEHKLSHKKTASSIHFNTYMKPIGNTSQKFRSLLETQKKQKELKEKIQLAKAMKMKQLSKSQYQHINPKYQSFIKKDIKKQQAIAKRVFQRQEQEMKGVTFKPITNKNYSVNASFEKRIVKCEKVKEQKMAGVLQEILKKQTFTPVTNPNNQVQSKIKSLWIKKKSQNTTSQSNIRSAATLSQIKEFEQLFKPSMKQSGLKLSAVSQFNFMIFDK